MFPSHEDASGPDRAREQRPTSTSSRCVQSNGEGENQVVRVAFRPKRLPVLNHWLRDIASSVGDNPLHFQGRRQRRGQWGRRFTFSRLLNEGELKGTGGAKGDRSFLVTSRLPRGNIWQWHIHEVSALGFLGEKDEGHD